MVDPLIASRAVHFASSLILGGAALYSAFIAQSPQRGQQQLMLAAIVVALLSGATWLLFLASKIAQSSVTAVIRDGTAWSVLTETQFGRVWLGRLVLGIVLFCLGLAGQSPPRRRGGLCSLLAALAVLFVGTLAWSGHAAGTGSFCGLVYFGGDVFHLISASAWVGGLVPLLMFIGPRVLGSLRLR
jgi:putative copper resistance protein D